VIAMSDPLKKVFLSARLKGRLCYGFEAITAKVAGERKGIANVRKLSDSPYGERVSRLLLLSSDGAERFYRHVEALLHEHSPRLLGCLLDIDSSALGELLAGKGSRIKVVMAEHKDVVIEALQAMVDDAGPIVTADP
jgi:hypothetical protein